MGNGEVSWSGISGKRQFAATKARRFMGSVRGRWRRLKVAGFTAPAG
jgi:hypothetical protein